jgi:chitin disaccharide deacetylase
VGGVPTAVKAAIACSPMTELTERLGYGDDARLVIINADGLGLSHASNAGTFEGLRDGIVTSASIMVPAPWAREAAYQYRGEDIGVHLTLNAEYDRYRWGPITRAPSLLDGDGGFPRTVTDLWDHADLDESRRELRAQIERAILWGFDITHLDSHLGALQLRPEFFDVYLDLAVEFQLPIRLSDASTERSIGFPFRSLADTEGVVFPDHFVAVPGIGSRQAIEAALADLPPGVTELQVHPAIDTPEQRAFDTSWTHRVDDHHLVCFDEHLPALLQRCGAQRIGYRALRTLQRAAD